MRRLVVTAFAVVAVLCLTRPALAQAGKYSLDGEHEDKGSYRGDCTIEKSNATWEVVENVRYSSGARERRAGKGTLSGSTLSVAFDVTPSASSTSYRLNARYSLASLDVLRGTLEKTTGADVATERLRRPGKGLVLVIANRQWEVQHLVSAFTKTQGMPSSIDGATVERIYHQDNAMGSEARRPRVRFRCDGYEVELWCIEDLTRAVPGWENLTRTKWDELARVFAGEGGDLAKPRKPAAVVTFGSGAGTTSVPNNGSVVVGSGVFVYDPFYSKTHDPWRADLGHLVEGSGSNLLDGLSAVRDEVEPTFSKPPVTAGTPRLYWGDDYVSVGEVNVEHNEDYEWADPLTCKAFTSRVKGRKIGAVDTAHGLFHLKAKSISDAPCVYVAGVLNRMGKFDELDKDPKGQTTTVMQNAAAVTLRLVPTVTKNLSK
ncbi:MAG: hypothetical protein ACAI25_11660 [Planctomycetota bacterium]